MSHETRAPITITIENTSHTTTGTDQYRVTMRYSSEGGPTEKIAAFFHSEDEGVGVLARRALGALVPMSPGRVGAN